MGLETEASAEVAELHKLAQEERVQQEQQVKEDLEQEEQEREGETSVEKPIDLLGGDTTVESSGESSDADEAANNEAADDDLPAFGTLESHVNNVNEVIPPIAHPPPLPHCRYPPPSTTATPPPLPPPIHCRYPHPSTTATPVPLPPPTALPHRNCHPPHHRVGQRISTPKVTLLLALSLSSLKIR